MKKPLLILTGPTAVGKTALSIDLARSVNGEIISADSMQVYKGMDIGSAKIRREEMQGVPHHLIDILEPEQAFDVLQFQTMAKQAIQDIYSRGRVPVLVGGTGFYIQSVLSDIDFTPIADNGQIRAGLEALAATQEGRDALYRRLEQADPASAKAIHPNNIKRVIRALEFFQLTGSRISDHNEEQRNHESPYCFLYCVLNTDRALLYERIERRVDEMMEQGLLEEVKKLKDRGLTSDLVSMQGLGYKELLEYLNGCCSLEEAVQKLKQNTRHFAKRQITWFRRERDVTWFDLPASHHNRAAVLDAILQEAERRGVLQAAEILQKRPENE